MTRLDLIRKLHILLSELNLMDNKHDLYEGYGVNSSKEMSDSQLLSLINTLQAQKETTESSRRKWLSACLTIITSEKWMGFPNGAWCEINAFVSSSNIGMGKELYRMNIEELQQCKQRLIMAYKKGFRYKKTEKTESNNKTVKLVVVGNISGNSIS